MSRPVAGVRKRSVIVTLPGAPKGACENLQAIAATLPHACLQASAALDSRALHVGGVERLEAEAGIGASKTVAASPSVRHHQCRHGHHGHGHAELTRFSLPAQNALSNDPHLGPTRRHRESPYPMLSVDDALSLIARHSPGPETVSLAVDQHLVGSILAEDIEAQEDVPSFRASIVDGYAVAVPSDDAVKGVFLVSTVSHAAVQAESSPLRQGEVARITTGAPLPPGATSVIMVEDTVIKSTTEDGKEEREVEIQAEGVLPGVNVREPGSDIQRGSVILQRGEPISGVGGEIGLLASAGVSQVKVYRRPVIGILSTGDEITDHRRPGPLRLGEVRDSNRISLMSAAKEWGFDVVDLGIARDELTSLEEVLRKGLRLSDVLITTGGVSMGEADLLKPTIERTLGGHIHFGRVAMKPGKPTTFATVPIKDRDGRRLSKPVFCLPGNPASALVTFHLFVLPCLHKMSGLAAVGLPRVQVVLADDFPLDPRPEYHRAIVTASRNGLLTASSTGGQRSSRVGSLRSANALVCLPSGEGVLAKGSRVDALLMDRLRPAEIPVAD